MELVLVRGLPGAGKSTFAKKNYPNHLIYEPDMLMCDLNGTYNFYSELWQEAINWTYKMVDRALASNKDVVTVEVFPTLEDIEIYQKLADYHRARLNIQTVVGCFQSIHSVPKQIFDDMENRFENLQHDYF